MTSKLMHKRLIAAINLLGEYAEENLPAEYDIVLTFRRTEATMDLIDPAGVEMDLTSPDSAESSFAAACLAAQELESEAN